MSKYSHTFRYDSEADFILQLDAMLQKLVQKDAQTQNARLRTACELTLLFYSVGPWTDDKRANWSQRMDALLGPAIERDERVTGSNQDGTWDGAMPTNEATTKNLCNAVRAALKAPAVPLANEADKLTDKTLGEKEP